MVHRVAVTLETNIETTSRLARLVQTPGIVRGACIVAATVLLAGCSVKQIAIRQLGSALADGTGGAFAAESDVEFAGQAVPFSLKLIESLLQAQPDNPDLLLAAASGFTQYAFVWVEQPAYFLESEDWTEAQRQRDRARAFYMRAHAYAMHALEVTHPGFSMRFTTAPDETLAGLMQEDVPLIYWSAASLGSAISIGKTDPELVARQTLFAALAERAYALDPDWGDGAVHELLMLYELSRPGGGTHAAARARSHFNRALEVSRGLRATPLVSFAETVCVQEQNKAEFIQLLNRALAIDSAKTPQYRLANVVMQKRALWLLGHVDELFLE